MTGKTQTLPLLLEEVRACTACATHLPHGVRPVVQAGHGAKLLIVGQAPGRKVHETGIPWNDPSGDRLRDWLGIGRDLFYDEKRIAIVPAGFCYPGTGKNGDLPPRPECAPLWHERLLAALPDIELTLLVGRYAQELYLRDNRQDSLTATVNAWRTYLPRMLPLPHPSPRNQRWWKSNSWFEQELLPELHTRIAHLFAQ